MTQEISKESTVMFVRVKGFDFYEINKDGIIKSFHKNKVRVVTPYYCKTSGYYRINLTREDGTRKKALLHRLLAEAFIPNPYNKEEVNHIDGNKLNNTLDNLEWVTRRENNLHAHKMKLRDNSGTGNPRNILKEQDVINIYLELLDGARVCDVADKYGVSRPAVADIKARRNWCDLLSEYPEIPHSKKDKDLSESTVRWICERIMEGLSTREILNITTNKNITDYRIQRIRAKQIYKHISKDYF